MSHPLWTLYNSVTEQTIENLDVPGCLAALSGVPAHELSVWFVWREGLADWKPILELPEFEALKPPTAARPPLSLVTDTPVSEAAPLPEAVDAPVAEFAAAAAAETAATPTFEEFAPEALPAHANSPYPAQEVNPPADHASAPHVVSEVAAYPADEPVFASQEVPAETPVDHEQFEKTSFGYDPADEVTKTSEFTATHFESTEVTEVTSHGHAAPEAWASEPQPAASPVTEAFTPSPAESAPQSPTPAPAATADDGTHLFWMTEGSDGALTPAHLDEMTGSHVYIGPAPVQLSPESEDLAAQAESMPESPDAVVGKVASPSRQASFPLASGSAPGGEQAPVAASGQDRRKYPRFDIRYRVIVRNDNLTFRTFSRNISLGGVALEMPVPEALLGSECQIYVGNPRTGENIRFSGKLVANRNDSQFFVFLKSSPDSLTKLQKWVEAHQSSAKRAV